MMYDYSYWQQKPRTVKTKTVREYEYDADGNVIKETVTFEETRYEDGNWGHPVIINKTVTDIQPPYTVTYKQSS